jgi:hypothetical protein
MMYSEVKLKSSGESFFLLETVLKRIAANAHLYRPY